MALPSPCGHRQLTPVDFAPLAFASQQRGGAKQQTGAGKPDWSAGEAAAESRRAPHDWQAMLSERPLTPRRHFSSASPQHETKPDQPNLQWP